VSTEEAAIGPTKSSADRIAEGQKRRSDISRVRHKDLNFKDRTFDPIELLLASTEQRLPELLPIKWARMQTSPFAFFRGAVSIMAADLARLPHTDIQVQLAGDAHVQNLGSFAAPDGKLVFDFNDFDETIRGPWEWDVKRMATSIVLAGREADHKQASCEDAAETFVERYTQSIASFAGEPILQVARHQIHREKAIKPISAALSQSQRATPLEVLRKLCEKNGRGEPRFRDAKPCSWRVRGDEAKEVLASLEPYREALRPESRHLFGLFRPVDVGFKVVGTGSVGLRDYIVLLEGNGPNDPLFLQIKQQVPSAYAPYLPNVVYPHEGRRAADGQRAIQPLSDLLLGWTSLGGHQFLVRQLNDHKGSIDLTQLRGTGLMSLAVVAGELLARGHSRSGDACMIYGYCGSGTKIQRALREFASQYADQTEVDYERFLEAIEKKKLKVADGPKS
jgi:uncharacterized protein (DUF2252 family)